MITHGLDPLNVCLHMGDCSSGPGGLDNRDITCAECDQHLREIKRHMSGDEDIARFIKLLKV